MIKLHASYARKVPGSEQYSSDSASASVEIELPEGANVPAKLAELWDITRSAVEQQLGQRQPANRVAQHMPPGNNGGSNGHHAPAQQPQGNGYSQPAPQNYPPRNGNGNGRGRHQRQAEGFREEPDR